MAVTLTVSSVFTIAKPVPMDQLATYAIRTLIAIAHRTATASRGFIIMARILSASLACLYARLAATTPHATSV